MNSSAPIALVENIFFQKNPLQDLLSSLNAVISTNESIRFITGHQSKQVTRSITWLILKSYRQQLPRLLFWQSQLLFRTEFRWSWIVVSTTKLRLKTWSKERWYGSFLAILQIFWSEFRSEIKQTATDRSNFQSEKQSALSNSRSGLLLIKILKEFLKNSNQRKKIIWYSFRSLLKIS